MNLRERSLALHKKARGKIEVRGKVPIENTDDLGLAYTPGVAEVCREIVSDGDLAYEYTGKGNLVGIVSDGSAVLGLGDVGPKAALPVMEGKALLFKALAGVDAIPLCVGTKSVEDIVSFVRWMEPTLGAVNLEDISAPRCFEIEERLKEVLAIPVFHDDQHGTAVVVLAALINGLKVVGKEMPRVKVVVCGAGAAGVATANLLLDAGFPRVILCDSRGVVYPGREEGMNQFKEKVCSRGNPQGKRGSLEEALEGADVFIGLSRGNMLDRRTVKRMGEKAIVLALANPVPEIFPEEAFSGGAAVVGTGRSDYHNQVNNVLAFPGIFKGALECRARYINGAMKLAAAAAIAELVGPDLSPNCIIPHPLDARVVPAVSRAVVRAAEKS